MKLEVLCERVTRETRSLCVEVADVARPDDVADALIASGVVDAETGWSQHGALPARWIDVHPADAANLPEVRVTGAKPGEFVVEVLP